MKQTFTCFFGYLFFLNVLVEQGGGSKLNETRIIKNAVNVFRRGVCQQAFGCELCVDLFGSRLVSRVVEHRNEAWSQQSLRCKSQMNGLWWHH